MYQLHTRLGKKDVLQTGTNTDSDLKKKLQGKPDDNDKSPFRYYIKLYIYRKDLEYIEKKKWGKYKRKLMLKFILASFHEMAALKTESN